MPNFGAPFADHLSALDRLKELRNFGDNPGNLYGLTFRPAGRDELLPLVVVLHGCTQTAVGYDTGAGWSSLADEAGFMLLFPEQKRANNPNLCFNWFSAADTRRDQGEALSIRQMIDKLVRDQSVDPARIFITGLSAGGAMTSVMLACYPDVFAGGAIIAGLPYGTANGVPQALERMQGKGLPSAEALGHLVRQASPHTGPWPTISVWHGDRDATVDIANADAILRQWRFVHQADIAPAITETIGGARHRTWRTAQGMPVIEDYTIATMGHGTPVDSSQPCGGHPGPFMLDVGLSSTRHIAARWGLATAPAGTQILPGSPVGWRERQNSTISKLPPQTVSHTDALHRPNSERKMIPIGVQQVIEKALRAAGLMP